MSWGNADDMRAVADDLDRIDKSLTATYVARAKSSTAKVKTLMKEDRLMDAAEAKEWGFADEVTSETRLAAKFSLRLLPKAAAEKFRAETGDGQGDPPPPAEPEKVPEVPPPPAPADPADPAKPVDPAKPADPPSPAAASAQVITLDAAKKQGIEEHRKYVGEVTDLCTLARQPERVGGYVRANTSIEQVRKELLDVRAAETVMPHHPLAPPAAPASAWEKITDKLNARFKK
jgi:enoyl-CoA hydratase/carnithine racemase